MFVIFKCSNNKINYKTDFDYLQYKQGHGFPAENIAAGVFSYLRWNHLLQLSLYAIISPISSVLQQGIQHIQYSSTIDG